MPQLPCYKKPPCSLCLEWLIPLPAGEPQPGPVLRGFVCKNGSVFRVFVASLEIEDR